jgi:hypothetical protein
MNKIKLILGIISLIVATALAVLNLTLSPDRIWFDVGYGNMPWVPPVVFAITGIVLLATAGIGSQREPNTTVQLKPKVIVDPEKAAFNKRLETVFWGLFLIMLAGWWLIPDETAPKGLWSIGVGLLLLGLNAVRYFSKIKMSGFTTFLGILSLLGGIIELTGVADLNGALLLIVLGAYLILKPWFEKQGLFGKAEES